MKLKTNLYCAAGFLFAALGAWALGGPPAAILVCGFSLGAYAIAEDALEKLQGLQKENRRYDPNTELLLGVPVRCPGCGRDACGHVCDCGRINYPPDPDSAGKTTRCDRPHRFCCTCGVCYLPAKETNHE